MNWQSVYDVREIFSNYFLLALDNRLLHNYEKKITLAIQKKKNIVEQDRIEQVF